MTIWELSNSIHREKEDPVQAYPQDFCLSRTGASFPRTTEIRASEGEKVPGQWKDDNPFSRSPGKRLN